MKFFVAAALLAATAAYADEPPPPSDGKPQTTVLTTDTVCPSPDGEANKAYEEANHAADAHDLDHAIERYQFAITRDPKFCDAMDNLGLLFRHRGETGDIEKAVALFKQAIAVAPKDKTAYMDLAVAQRVQKKLADALATYQALVKIDDLDPEGWFGVGSVYEQQKDFADAIDPLDRARKLYQLDAPNLVDDATTLLGMAYAETQQWQKAIDSLESIYAHYGGDGHINLYLGRAYANLKNPTKAKAFYQRAEAAGTVPTDDEWKAVGGR